jgi:dTMP kinase
MEAEKLAFHEAVRRGFLDQAAREPERIRVVSAAGAVEDVTARVAAVLEEALWPARSGARCNT